ncbi:hypothetical protein BKA65DRAFT_89311 [Rhexocercosporidium sp. MPI-PUGE-AT-0058]|nr:hypothetical protein BKA65DRAFT_89311 [Rhexocercosporidium sp. MPI-PUGE-AT-0058]
MAPITNPPKKSIRASKPKTRSGCKTCKIRRVKCDEAKPTCNRCLKFGVTCDGYSAPTPVPTSLPPIRIILPKGQSHFQPIVYQPAITVFQDQQERRYFQYFREGIAPHLAGSFESDLWSHLVLQACERDDSIRHAIVAIAALKSTANATLGHDIKYRRGGEDASLHQGFAFRQYQKALKCMRKASVGGAQDLRTALITCIVIICFESFAGNFEFAVRQAVVGLNLVEKHLSNEDAGTTENSSVEKEIINAFGRIDIQAMAFLDPRYPKRLQLVKDERLILSEIPHEFISLNEARDSLISIMQKVMQFTSAMFPETFTFTGFLRLDFMMCIPLEHIDRQLMHIAELEAWRSAISPIIEDSLQASGSNNRFGAASLELMYLAGFVTTCLMRTYTGACPSTMQFMPQFEQMVTLSEELLHHPNMNQSNATYMFEMHTICPLYAVSWYCPQKTLRRKAISLLLGPPRREALWDSVMVGKLAEWIMNLEDENYEGEYAPEHVRCTRGDILGYNMVTREAEVRSFVPARDSVEVVSRTAMLNF